MEKEMILTEEQIVSKIYIIRGHKVMLDSDLAILYNVATRILNQSVKRNIERFPTDFMFELNENEWKNLTNEFGELNDWGGRRKRPYVFTEQGVAMLSGILNSSIAINVNIQIMRTFIKVRHILSETTEIRLEIEKIKKDLHKHTKTFEIIFDNLDELNNKMVQVEENEKQLKRQKIGFKS
jgi:uncharacterized protein YdcH (DUF465 family)